jgi:hypothetical protein
MKNLIELAQSRSLTPELQKAMYDAAECIQALAWDLAFDRAIREGRTIREAAKEAEKKYKEGIPYHYRHLV